MDFPTSRPNRRIVIIDRERSGQPRPYADHERVSLVTIFQYDDLGRPIDASKFENMMKQNALSAVGGDKYVQVGERKSDTLDNHAKTFVESVEVIEPNQIRIVIKEPYID